VAASSAQGQPDAANLLGRLLGLAVASKAEAALVQGLGDLVHGAGGHPEVWRWAALAGFLDAVERRGGSLQSFLAEADPALKQVVQELEPLFVHARAAVERVAQSGAGSSGGDSPDWVAACRLLGRDSTGQTEDVDRLGRLLGPQFPEKVTRMVVDCLARLKPDHTADVLLAGWKSYSPTLRDAVTATLFTRGEWVERFLAAVEHAQVAVGQVGQAYRQKLLTHSREAIRERAAKLFSAANADRQKILEEYKVVGTLQGDVGKGAVLFQQNCSLCHRVHNQGKSVGPDLGMMADKSTQTFLIAILDPNQAVEARYLSYTAETKSGQELSGIIAAETPSSITLRAANGLEEVILRDDLVELTGSGLSLMPEGFEKILKPQDLADLIAFLKSP
jgi:putative heme-binding domain-containing protein